MRHCTINTKEIGMLKAALAGMLLATTGVTFVSAQEYQTASYESRSAGPRVTEGHIARLRAALKLTALQQRYWPAVESALRNLSHRQGRDHASTGMLRRAAAAVGDADGVRRVASAASPLIGTLDDKQKQDGMRVIRAMGFGSLAAAL
jgi:hypothetical protein